MDFFDVCCIAAALSLDAFGIGVSCTVKGTRLPLPSRLILCLVSAAVTAAALLIGRAVTAFLPFPPEAHPESILLLLLGLWMLLSSLPRKDPKKTLPDKGLPSAARHLMEQPEASDFDHSRSIEWWEALALGLVLSADCFAAGLGFGGRRGQELLPLLCGGFQLLMLTLGSLAGGRLRSLSGTPRLWSALAGAVLIVLSAVQAI